MHLPLGQASGLPLGQASLRLWRMDDAPALAEAANNRNVWINLRDRMPHPYTLADAEAFILQRVKQDSGLVLCVEVEGRAAGGIGLHPGDDVNRLTAELGYWLAEPFWGRGVITAAVRAIVPCGFERLSLERIEACVYANNPASARVLKKAGFTCEGRLRRSVIKDDQVLDSLVYARLREEESA